MIPAVLGTTALSASQSLWTPSQLSLNVWLDAADSSTFSVSSSLVDQWRDKSGNNRHFSQTGSARPTFSSNAVLFDGIDDFIAGSHGLGTNPSDFAVFFTIKMNNVTSGTCRSKIVLGNRTSNTQIAFIGMPQHFSSTAWGIRAPFADRNAGLGNATVGTHIYGLIKSGMTYFVSVNGVLSNPINISGNLIFTDVVEIGRSSPFDSLSFFSMELYELIICPISTFDREKLEGYLAHKWSLTNNLPSNHPYKNSPPS